MMACLPLLDNNPLLLQPRFSLPFHPDWDMRVFSGGAGSKDEFTHIHVLGGGHLVMRDPVAVGEPGERVERRVPIAVTTLDSLLADETRVRQVTFLKIDTDGMLLPPSSAFGHPLLSLPSAAPLSPSLSFLNVGVLALATGHELQVLKGARNWMESGPGMKYAKIEFVPYALEQGNGGDPGAAQELLKLMRGWDFAMFNIIWRGAMEGEFFCIDDLVPLHPEHDRDWISRLRRVDTYAGTNILGVNRSHVADMAFDLACMPDDLYT